MKICKVENCDNKYFCKGYCIKHYGQIYQYGKILERTIKDKNEIIDCGDYYEICLYSIKHKEIARTKIDKDDLDKVKKYKWSLNNKGYVITTTNKKKILLHRLIMDFPKNLEVDHINHDVKDNRKQSLRCCTRSQNQMNNKNAKGYCWNKVRNKWQASIVINHKQIHLGLFEKEEDVIKMSKEVRKKYFKEFACN